MRVRPFVPTSDLDVLVDCTLRYPPAKVSCFALRSPFTQHFGLCSAELCFALRYVAVNVKDIKYHAPCVKHAPCVCLRISLRPAKQPKRFLKTLLQQERARSYMGGQVEASKGRTENRGGLRRGSECVNTRQRRAWSHVGRDFQGNRAL
jgi:hypothetical protein